MAMEKVYMGGGLFSGAEREMTSRKSRVDDAEKLGGVGEIGKHDCGRVGGEVGDGVPAGGDGDGVRTDDLAALDVVRRVADDERVLRGRGNGVSGWGAGLG